MSLQPEQQAAHPGDIISLYTIDAAQIGGAVHRFVNGPWRGADATYNGQTYTSTPIGVEGIAYGGDGAVPRPRLTLARLDEMLVSAILRVEHWRGARFVRLRTLLKHLDGGEAPNPARHWPPDVYRIERRQRETKEEITFQLASPLDLDKKQLPGRQVLRDVCPWPYRIWHAAENTFDYTHASCPYRGGHYFDREDNPVSSPAQDRCSQRLSGCLARYPERVVPFGGYVGVGRFRGK